MLKPLFSETSIGRYGRFELEIKVGAPNDTDLGNSKIQEAAYEAAELIKSAVMQESIKRDAKAQLEAAKDRAAIIGLFDGIDDNITVEEIPNGYCSKWCCKHLPWFAIRTSLGKFIVGMRKRVLSIDWECTFGTQTADDLFPNENVTKNGRSIHAWNLQDAKRYITAIYDN